MAFGILPSTLGDAKFVSNIANQKADYQIAVLYKESADWSSVIRDVSQDKIAREIWPNFAVPDGTVAPLDICAEFHERA